MYKSIYVPIHMYIHEHTSVCAYAHACIHMHAHTDVKMSLAFLIYPVQAPLISSPAQTSLLCKGFFKYHRTHYSCLGGGGVIAVPTGSVSADSPASLGRASCTHSNSLSRVLTLFSSPFTCASIPCHTQHIIECASRYYIKAKLQGSCLSRAGSSGNF